MNIEIFSTTTSNVPDNEIKSVNGKNYYYWGNNNDYPNYLKMLLDNNTLLQTITDGIGQYVAGDACTLDKLNDKINVRNLLISIMKDRLIYGGFAIQVIYNPLEEIIDLRHIPFDRCRMSVDEQSVLYYKYWGTNKRAGAGINKAIKYPLYNMTEGPKTSEIFYYNQNSIDIYPESPIQGSLRAIETYNEIQNYHYSAIKNNFAPSAIINFNNGQPSEEEKDKIYKKLKEKFSGSSNAGKFLVCYNNNTESATTINRLEEDSFDSKYDALSKSVKESIFVCFRAQPIIFGMQIDGVVFSQQNYEEAFKLFNKTVIKSYQSEMEDSFKNLGFNLIIEPFSLEEEEKIVE